MRHWLLPALSAFTCWGIWAFLPKITTRYVGPNSAIVYEVLGGVVVAAVMLIALGPRLEWDMRGAGLAFVTGVLGVVGALGYLFAVMRGPVTLIATLTALYPILTLLLAYAFLHEPLTLRQGVGVVLALVAIVLIAG